MYKYLRTNPKGVSRDDCAVRCLCVINGKPWIDNYRDLCKTGEAICDMPNSVFTIDRYMSRHGYSCVHIPAGMTLGQFTETYVNGTYAVMCKCHLTPVVDGVCYDTVYPIHAKVAKAYKIK